MFPRLIFIALEGRSCRILIRRERGKISIIQLLRLQITKRFSWAVAVCFPQKWNTILIVETSRHSSSIAFQLPTKKILWPVTCIQYRSYQRQKMSLAALTRDIDKWNGWIFGVYMLSRMLLFYNSSTSPVLLKSQSTGTLLPFYKDRYLDDAEDSSCFGMHQFRKAVEES